MKVVFLPEVEDKLFELSEILYQKDYFGFKESAVKYVTELILDIEASLHTKIKKAAPSYFNKHGRAIQYSTFKKNNNTQWYVFFTTHISNGELIYLVRHISNNHIDAKYFPGY